MQTLNPLVSWDWAVIIAFFVITLGIGFYFSKRATKSLDDYFVAGRKMTWWVAGTSIVATSFAADTPLVIGGWMRNLGLERNWFWWGTIMGFMLCAFFYARLWRRANILTDVEYNEIRYAGAPAAALRAYHATYRSLIQNTLVMGWVTLAMAKILEVTLNIPTLVFLEGEFLPLMVANGVDIASILDGRTIADWPLIGEAIFLPKATGIILCMTVGVIYTVASGLWGVMATDFFQFFFAMLGAVILMIMAFAVSGGAGSMIDKAEDAVRSGIVINQAPIDRQILPEGSLTDSTITTKLLEGGILQKITNEKAIDELRWNIPYTKESELKERLAFIGVQQPKAVLDLWQTAYTINTIRFTDFVAVDGAVAGGVLLNDFSDRSGEPPYYRLPNLSISADELIAQLESVSVVNKGEILAAFRGDRVTPVTKITNFLPPFDLKGGGLLAIWAFAVFLGLQWWAASEGGGFLAQRLFSCKNERHSVLAMLWFNMMHFAMRPWPWIVVGIASLFLIPDVTQYGAHYDYEHAYVIMLMKYLPVGLKGLMVATLMAAYMSTISTHVNFGASYVINDLYKRFINRKGSDRHQVFASQVVSVFLAIIAAIYAYTQTTILSGWLTFFELMSGAGIVVLLRWYWWRISAWSELAAMTASILFFVLMNHTPVFHWLFSLIGLPGFYLDEYAVRFTLNILLSTVVWVTVTFLTPPVKEEHLVSYYQRIRPAGIWKESIKEAAKVKNPLKIGWVEWVAWATGTTGLFAMIFAFGKLCFGQYLSSLPYAIYAIIATIAVLKLVGKMDWTGMNATAEEKSSK